MPINITNVNQISQHNLQDVVNQGTITLGGKNYRVTLAHDQVRVERQGLQNMSIGARIANGVKEFFGRLFTEGAVTTRASRLQGVLQGMQNTAQAQTYIARFRNDIQMSHQALVQQNHSVQNHITTTVQDMSDDDGTRQFLLAHMNDPNFSSDRFTGIEKHPTDPAKFIAKFGDQQIELSNRSTAAREYRGTVLKEQLSHGHYQNLGDLIGQNYLTRRDAMFVYAYSPVVQNLRHDMSNLTPEVRNLVIAGIRNDPIGNTTVGEAFGSMLR